MTHKILFRTALLGITAALLAACPSKSTKYPIDTVVYGPDRPTGTPHALGTTVRPGGGASYVVVKHSDLPHWEIQQFADSLKSFKRGCEKLKNRQGWQDVCAQAAQTRNHHAAAKSFFERYFTPWEVSGNGSQAGTVTGYYIPLMNGDVKQTGKARFPIYGIPNDFVSVPLPSNLRGSKSTVRIRATGQNSGVIDKAGSHTADLSKFPITARTTALKGRFEGSRFVPYHTRSQINGGALNGKAPILGYADDPVELFFMHIQGSGTLQTPSGQKVALGYADKNEHPYKSIGRYMADKGYLTLGQTTMQGIKAYMQQNPQKLAEVLGQNPSYVFFRKLDNADGAIGALGTPLMGEYAGAVDRHYITLGAPLFVATAHPVTGKALNRLIMAQDTGSAIKGAVRVDYFWGYGDAAGEVAGKQKTTGYVWQLLPNGMEPKYRP
ncbi:murein transglycosylase A [Neisseria animalis]|uniref:peptidoglycan lytic exotransglycosylase n=1 Tax=Neisseria animalis TaxID=492 RepID=A0A5P3MSZ7_NEIAN|nr:murein transglycosylase A [Neisseria animalis]QEY23911.1 murein transglycosylase [Neisseria animalis]ROW32021.1 murein transglycosylase [Neisseria animalis]VEE05847.1 outer membrane lipoprotein Gna33 [Neisseria animalis]